MQFHKVEGNGNDFVLFDQLGELCHQAQLNLFIRHVCDRRSGVGADGVLQLLRRDDGNDLRMWNPDGSESSMCGNALRAVASYLQPVEGVDLQIGDRLVRVQRVGLDWETRMGAPIWDLVEAGFIPDVALELEGQVGIAVGFPNPHVIVMQDDLKGFPLQYWGPRWEHHPSARERTNVHFVERIHRGHVKCLTWERGAGATLACGSGACAVAAVVRHKFGDGSPDLRVSMPGGDLTVRFEEEIAWLRGQGSYVFRGVIRSPIDAAET